MNSRPSPVIIGKNATQPSGTRRWLLRECSNYSILPIYEFLNNSYGEVQWTE